MGLNRYTLDTSAYGHFCAQHSRVVALLDTAGWIGLPVVTQGELWAGFLKSRRREDNIDRLNAFLRHPYVETVPTDGEQAQRYGEIADSLRQLGRPIPTNDIWIAASAICSSSTLLTFDAHFDLVPGLRVLILT